MRTISGRFLAAIGAAALIAGCSGGAATAPPGATAAPLGQASAPPAATAGGQAAGVSQLNLRFANFLASQGAAGPAIDIYDDGLKDATGAVVATAKPLVADLKYGAISAYVQPALPPNGLPLHFYGLPAGTSPATSGAQAPQVGFAVEGNDQATIVSTWTSSDPLTATSFLGSIGSVGFVTVVENGDGAAFNANPGPPAPSPAAGQALLLASTNYLPQGLNNLNYLLIDNSCAPPLNGDPNSSGVPDIFAAGGATPKSIFALFAASAGTHHVAVVAKPQGNTPTCKDLTPRQDDQTITLTAGEEAFAWAYGTSITDMHLAVAPIAP